MRQKEATVAADLGAEVEEEWYPRLATEYHVRDGRTTQ
jgi:hypothetical protein